MPPSNIAEGLANIIFSVEYVAVELLVGVSVAVQLNTWALEIALRDLALFEQPLLAC